MSYVIAAIAITGQVVSTFATVEAGKARQEALERRAEEEKFAAQTEELKRQEQLNAIQAAAAALSRLCSELEINAWKIDAFHEESLESLSFKFVQQSCNKMVGILWCMFYLST